MKVELVQALKLFINTNIIIKFMKYQYSKLIKLIKLKLKIVELLNYTILILTVNSNQPMNHHHVMLMLS